MATTGVILTYWKKRWVRFVLIAMALLMALFLFRHSIFRSIGNWLDAEDPLQATDAAFVLGGNSFERGLEATKVFRKFPRTQMISTGANVPLQLMAFDTVMTEAELSRMLMIREGVPDSMCFALSAGTSTKEESEAILEYCKEHSFGKITIISSSFHLRRVTWVFDDLFRENGIEVYYHGASSRDFQPDNWWNSEEGLITVNNELMKLCYYIFKY